MTTSTTGLRETLDPKALEAAREAIPVAIAHYIEPVIRAYLAALPSPNGSGEVSEYGGADNGLSMADALSASKGWKLVPAEPTPEMYGAGGAEQFKCDMASTPVREAVGRVYRAMLAAAPAPALPEAKPVADEEPIAWLVYVAFPPDGSEARYEVAEPGEDNAFPVYASPVQVDREAVIEECAKWHDQRAQDTPDAFEMEFHQASAAALRALIAQQAKP